MMMDRYPRGVFFFFFFTFARESNDADMMGRDIDLADDYPYTGWIPPEYRNWTQVYSRPVVQDQDKDNGPGFSVNENNIVNYNGTEDGKVSRLPPTQKNSFPVCDYV